MYSPLLRPKASKANTYFIGGGKLYFSFLKHLQKPNLQSFLQPELILVDHLAVPLHGVSILFVEDELLVVFFGHLDAVVEIAQPDDLADGIFFDDLVYN